MALLSVCSIRDMKGNTFFPPEFNSTKEVITRSYREAINSGSAIISKYPEDFDLYELGFFDTEKAEFDLYQQPKHVCNLAILKDPSE